MTRRNFGSEEGSGFNAISKTYKTNPTLEHYVKLRRENPDSEIEIAVIGGIEQLHFMERELKRFGFDSFLVAGVLDSDPECIGELSLQIMEKIIEARTLSKRGETQLSRRRMAIPDKLVDWLIACMLDGLSWNDNLHIPRDLIVLIRERLGGSNREYEQASKAHARRWQAVLIGAQLKACGHSPSFRWLGRILGVAPSTVKRWFPEGDFLREIETVSSWFDGDGQVRPVSVLLGKPLREK